MSSKNLTSNNPKPIIIISGNNTIENQNIRTNKIIIENNGHKAQYETQDKLNKNMIDSTVTFLKQNITTKNQQQHHNTPNRNISPYNHIDQQITTVESNINPNNNNNKEKLPLKDNSISQQDQQTQRNRISDSNLIPTEQQNTFPIVVALVSNSNNNDNNVNNDNISMHKKVITSLTENGNLINQVNDDNDYENMNENLTSRITSSCLICEKITPKSNLYHSTMCSHGICRKCIKLYYEDKIEDGIIDNFKCPVYSCKGHFNESLIKVFISSKLFNIAIDKQDKCNNNNNSLSETSIDTVKMYQEEHVLDINDNKTFFLYPKEKLNACPRCKKEALFGKTNYYFVKCLNCQMKMCRWCLKEFDDDHFDLFKVNHCRVYFRNAIEDDKECKCSKSCICKYLCELFFVIAGFFMMFIGGFCYISTCVNCMFCQCEQKGKEKGKCIGCFVTTLLVVIKVIVFVMCVPLLLVTFPFFPVFIAMIGM